MCHHHKDINMDDIAGKNEKGTKLFIFQNECNRELETLEEADFAMDEDVYNIITYRVMLF
jgi:hypothetical protein